TNIDPLLTGAQEAVFKKTVVVFNGIAYPLIGAIWTWLIVSLVRPFREQLAGGIADTARRLRAQRLVINLPWWGLGLFGAGWATGGRCARRCSCWRSRMAVTASTPRSSFSCRCPSPSRG